MLIMSVMGSFAAFFRHPYSSLFYLLAVLWSVVYLAVLSCGYAGIGLYRFKARQVANFALGNDKAKLSELDTWLPALAALLVRGTINAAESGTKTIGAAIVESALSEGGTNSTDSGKAPDRDIARSSDKTATTEQE